MATPLAMRSANPALGAETFRAAPRAIGDEAMTIQGTVNKTALGLVVLLVAATYTWNLGIRDPRVPVFMMVGVIGGGRMGAGIAQLAAFKGFDVTGGVEGHELSIQHLGLLGVRERLAVVGGSLEVESSTGGGTTVYVRIPL